MVKCVIKNTCTMRFERLEDVEAFHEQLKKDAAENDYQLTDFKYSVKFVKEKGEIVQEYYLVSFTYVLDDLKDPSYRWNHIEFADTDKIEQ